jgi:hypothetical protein
MTYQEFLWKLGQTPRRWEINTFGCIRYKKTGQCPIEKVTGTKAHNIYTDCEASGLRYSVQTSIIKAADNSPLRPRPRTRRDLLRACGLNK